jgi:tRNA nucleotidyltransferase/poly(A) polymerase
MTAAGFPVYIEKVLAALETAGFEAYVVGGAVRDLLSGTEPEDFDVTTKARPEEVCAVARHAGWGLVDKLGQNLGVVVVLVDGHSVEVATFRGERYGADAHRPAAVWYCDSLEEDLSRRDFTVNAMAMDRNGKVYDFHGGRRDLALRVLRTVGNPRRRYAEDALRMYRACRFVAQLGFTYVEGEDTPDDVVWDYDPEQSLEANLQRGAAEALAWKEQTGTPYGFVCRALLIS